MADSSAAACSPLSRYNAKRDFKITSEPAAEKRRAMDDHDRAGNVSVEKADPWQGYWAKRQTLDYAMETLG